MKFQSLGQKITAGFSAVIVLVVALAASTLVQNWRAKAKSSELSEKFVPETRIVHDMGSNLDEVFLSIRTYALTADEKFLKQGQSNIAKVRHNLDQAKSLVSAHPELVALKQHLGEIEQYLAAYESGIGMTVKANQALLAGRAELNLAATQFVNGIDELIDAQKISLTEETNGGEAPQKLSERQQKLYIAYGIRGLGNDARIAVFKGQALRDVAVVEAGMNGFTKMDDYFTALRHLLKEPSELADLETIAKAAHDYRDAMQTVVVEMRALDDAGAKRNLAYETLSKVTEEVVSVGIKRTLESAEGSTSLLNQTSLLSWVIGLLSCLGGMAISYYIVQNASTALRRVSAIIEANSAQLVSAAGQVSSASHSLAEGASEQAASLEETSASIEQMSGMTARNTESAEKAKGITSEARKSADVAAASVERMSRAMQEMQAANSQIGKIIKTIDEIAFQTNILALNAAVEAARAGEAGAGFAVVAEEVRALAQRSAKAAKETAEQIEMALSKSREGAAISTEVAANLGSIIEQVRGVDALVHEIAQASKEQSDGIKQINVAVTEMDKVTQGNAAGAEESASAAAELNAEAREFQKVVEQLKVLAGLVAASKDVSTGQETLPELNSGTDHLRVT